MVLYAGRTANGIPRMAHALAENPKLRIIGAVVRPLTLTPKDLASLPRVAYLEELGCTENDNLPQTNWWGMRLSDVVALIEPRPEARFVRVGAGPYALPVALSDADTVLLCDQLDGAPLAVEQGGPWRLVVPSTRYCTSVKWVNQLEFTVEPPDNAVERIAQARARAREFKQK